MVQIVKNFWNEFGVIYPQAMTEEISILEMNTGVKFPQDYLELMLQHNGGNVINSNFIYLDKYRKDIEIGSIGSMLHLTWKEYPYDSILGLHSSPPEFFPNGLVPFADDGGGNLTCFDYRKTKKDPPIVFWVHDDPEGEDVHFIANNFEEFINILHEPRD